MKVRVPSRYEAELVALGCNWSVISHAWIVPVAVRPQVRDILARIRAEGLLCDEF
jgi:hypothetical protein